ncbi:hypothetical protein ABW21_db0207450 [Orbilia brochopaga]|nr:hypothetical protein ABW21_db0207450 [Drechslerella brochopaga]
MPSFKDTACDILVDGVPVPVQACTESNGIVKAWIIAKTDTPYEIALQFSEKNAPRHSYHLIVDGRCAQSCTTSRTKSVIQQIRCGTGMVAGEPVWAMSDLLFDDLELVDSNYANAENRASVLRNIGKIEVEISRRQKPLEKVCNTAEIDETKNYILLDGYLPVSKAQADRHKISHRTVPARQGSTRNMYPYYHTKPLVPSERCFVKFIIYYASEEMLKARGVLPGSKRQRSPFRKFWAPKKSETSSKAASSIYDEKADSLFSLSEKDRLSILSGFEKEDAGEKESRKARKFFCF